MDSDDDTNYYRAPPSADSSPLVNGRNSASSRGYSHQHTLNNNSTVVAATSFHPQKGSSASTGLREPPKMESSARNTFSSISSPSSSPPPNNALSPGTANYGGTSHIAHNRTGSDARSPTPPRASIYHGSNSSGNSSNNFNVRSRTGSGIDSNALPNNHTSNASNHVNGQGSRSSSASPKPMMLNHTPPRRHSPSDAETPNGAATTTASAPIAAVLVADDSEVAELTSQQQHRNKSSTGFRHMRRPSSPNEADVASTAHDPQGNSVTTGATGAGASCSGVLSISNGRRSSSAPTPAESELNATYTPFNVANPSPDPCCISYATLVTYAEFCANIPINALHGGSSTTPRDPIVSRSTGTGPASFVENNCRNDLNKTLTPATSKAPVTSPPVPAGSAVPVLYSASPFGEEDHLSTVAFAATSNAMLVADQTANASVISEADSSSAEAAATAFLRKPLTAFCRPGCQQQLKVENNDPVNEYTNVGRTGSNVSTISGGGACRTTSGASSVAVTEGAAIVGGPTYLLHQHYCHKPIPAHTPQRTPRVGLLTPTDVPFGEERSPNEYRTGAGDEDGQFEGIPEGLLATEGTALSASFSLAPTIVCTPGDPNATAGNALSPSNNTQPHEDPKQAIITSIDLVAYHGTISCVIGDVMGRVDLMEAREPRTVLPSAASLFSKRHMLRGSMHFGRGNSVSTLLGRGNVEGDVSDSASNATATPQTGHSPAQGFSPAAGEISDSTIITPVVGTPTAGGLGLNAGYKNANQPHVSHTRVDSLDDPNVGISLNGVSVNSGSTQRPIVGRTPGAASNQSPKASKFVKRCSHQAFVEEFDCRKSNTIDHQLRCVRFLPANRSPGVTSYLAANEKTIKLFRIRAEQFQHAHSAQHNQMIHLRRRSNNVGGILADRSSITSLGSPDHDLGGMFANNGDYYPVTPRQRFHKRIVMPVKAFTNVHQYNIQSLSLSADNETFLSLDDLQVFWWHLEAQDTTKATKLADLKPESGQPDILLTAAAFHPQHGSLFLVSNSNGVCEIGDLRDPPCRKKRDYQISFQIKPEMHNSVVHNDHNDILSAISAASFMGKDFVVTRDYISLKMWDMRNPTHPVATCPVMDYLAPTLDFLYDKDYIFDRFPLAVDDQSLTVATGLYAGTVAVWRPGRESAGDRYPQGVRSGVYGTLTHQQKFLFDEVEFFSASNSAKAPDELAVPNAVASGQTTLDDVVKRIVIDTASDDDEPPEEETQSHEPLDEEFDTTAADGPVYPRMRSQAHTDRVTNVAISQGGDRIAFTTNDHLFAFARR